MVVMVMLAVKLVEIDGDDRTCSGYDVVMILVMAVLVMI